MKKAVWAVVGGYGLGEVVVFSLFADRLMAAIREKNAAACVGIDPLVERLPSEVLQTHGVGHTESLSDAGADADRCAGAILDYGSEVIRIVAPYVPAIKINIAFFERYHASGIRAYHQLIQQGQDAGLMVIGDVKRADIGHTSMQYARAHLGGASGDVEHSTAAADAITVNPYFGFDGVGPFLEVAKTHGRGVFVLVQTSNPSASQVQGLRLSQEVTVCQKVALLVQEWAADKALIGQSGYSGVGAVVSPRDLESTVQIRAMMPQCIFLVPGFGAQGRTRDEVARCFQPDGTGALVTASRSVIYAYDDPSLRDSQRAGWRSAIDNACRDFVRQIRTLA